MATVVTVNDEQISVWDMKDGQVAEIIEWHSPSAIGQVIQRYDDKIIFIGQTWGKAYDTLLQTKDQGKNIVRILPKGSKIVL